MVEEIFLVVGRGESDFIDNRITTLEQQGVNIIAGGHSLTVSERLRKNYPPPRRVRIEGGTLQNCVFALIRVCLQQGYEVTVDAENLVWQCESTPRHNGGPEAESFLRLLLRNYGLDSHPNLEFKHGE